MYVITQGFLGGVSSLIVQGYLSTVVHVFAGDQGTVYDGSRTPASYLDTFTDTADTALSSHTPDSGGSWTLHPSYSGAAVISTGNKARSISSSASVYYHSADPSSADYDVTVDITAAGSHVNHFAGPVGRIDTASDTYYSAVYDLNLDVFKLRKTVAGTLTTLASGSSGQDAGRRVTLRMQGTTIQLLLDGNLECQATDSAIGAPGKSGVYFNGAATDSTGIFLDNWRFTDGIAANVPAWMISLLFGQDGISFSEPTHFALARFVADSAILQEQWTQTASILARDTWTTLETAAISAASFATDAALQAEGSPPPFSITPYTAPIITQGFGFGIGYLVPQGYKSWTDSFGTLFGADAWAIAEAQWLSASTVSFDQAAGAENSGAASPDSTLVSVDTIFATEAQWLFKQIFGTDLAAASELAVPYAATFAADQGTLDSSSQRTTAIFAADTISGAEWSAQVLAIFAADTISADSLDLVEATTFAVDLGTVVNWSPVLSSLQYRIYANAGDGGPIDYSTYIASTTSLGYPIPLSYPGSYRYAVRVYDPVTTLEEKNLDARVDVVLDGLGNDITNQPGPPLSLQAAPLTGGSVRVQWIYSPPAAGKAPTGFHVYVGSGTPSYATPAATIAYHGPGSYMHDLSGLTDGATYGIGVRAYNASGEEANLTAVTVTADATGPGGVDSFTLTASSDALTD